MENICQYWDLQMSKSAELFRAGNLSDAETVLKDLINAVSNAQEIAPLQKCETLSRLILVLTKSGSLAEAQHFVEKAIDLLQQEGLQQNPLCLTLLLQNLNIVRALPDKSDYKSTLEYTLVIFTKMLGKDHANTRALQAELESLLAHKEPEHKQIIENIPQVEQAAEANTTQIAAYRRSVQSSIQNAAAGAVTKESTTVNSMEEEAEHAVIRDLPLSLNSYVLNREKTYSAIALTLAIFFYLVLICALNLALLVIVPILALFGMIGHGLFCGHLRGSCIRINHEQFPEINQMVEEICSKLNMPVPAVYIMNGEGILNAFATRLLSRDFVVLYSNILEMAYEKGMNEVAFVLAHELAHIKQGHTKWQFLYFPAYIIPFLEKAYSRARESTCDRIAAGICPNGAKWGLVALATGKKLYRRVNLPVLYKQFDKEYGFWAWFAEILSDHPSLVRRIKMCGCSLNDEQEDLDFAYDKHSDSIASSLTPRLLPNFIK